MTATIDVKIPDLDLSTQVDDLSNGLQDYLVDELFTRIRARTPVRTGKAQNGWEVDGRSIVNDVDYVIYLEYGWSQQAPSGMIRVSLAEVPALIDKYLSEHPGERT